MEQDSGILFDLRRFSIHDGPGIRTAVFFKGCPLHCTWCHNPESQKSGPELILRPLRCIHCQACLEACPHGAITFRDGISYTDREKCQVCGNCVNACHAEARQLVGRVYSVAEVIETVLRDRPFYEESGGGVTFTGGEPLLQPRFLGALLQAAKEQNLHTVLDTSGQAAWQTIDRLRNLVDLFLYDIKIMDTERHRRYTGVSNQRILSNLRRLADHGHQIILRLPVVPGINDSLEDVEAVGRYAASLPGIERIDLLAYHNAAQSKYEGLGRDYPLAALHSPAMEQMEETAAQLGAFGLKVKIGG
ncbi:MAG: glycyl-radical enzyme activating protein [Anaerolineales bacterium]|nr:glycyl-radical enzyme activating protein [Anaerolineales bacterium]